MRLTPRHLMTIAFAVLASSAIAAPPQVNVNGATSRHGTTTGNSGREFRGTRRDSHAQRARQALEAGPRQQPSFARPIANSRGSQANQAVQALNLGPYEPGLSSASQAAAALAPPASLPPNSALPKSSPHSPTPNPIHSRSNARPIALPMSFANSPNAAMTRQPTQAEQALEILNGPSRNGPSQNGASRVARRTTTAEIAVRALARGRVDATPGVGHRSAQGFPSLPPDPYADQQPALPSLYEELQNHGGAYLYTPEGDRLNAPPHEPGHEPLRLPEDWVAPEPLTVFSEFLGADPINPRDDLRWFNGPYIWHPQIVGYGNLQVFGGAFEQNSQRQEFIGHQVEIDVDLRLTGTDRFHVQLRPLGDGASGGSFYRFSDPEGYVNNSTAEPQRYWFEAELPSLLGGIVDPFAPNDFHMAVGRFPFQLHNNLLMNDEVVGFVINKNTIFVGDLSNLNLQFLYAFNDVDTYAGIDSQMFGIHASADWDRVFYEATYATVRPQGDPSRNTHYGAISRTQILGPWTLAGRALFKWGDEGGVGSGELFVLEANYGRYFESRPFGFESAVYYCNAFAAGAGWNSIGGGNFNRIRTAFEVNPLVRLSAGPGSADTVGVALGAQLFRHHKDESLTPEFAFEAPTGDAVWGFGMRYLRKTSARSFMEIYGVVNYSDNPLYERDGIFSSYTILF